MKTADHLELLADDFGWIMDQSREDFLALDGSTVLITGGSGFFGTWLAHSCLYALQNSSFRCKIKIACREPGRFLDKYPYFRDQSNFVLIPQDMTAKIHGSLGADFIVHAATSASAKMNVESPLEMIDTIVQGTRNILDFAAQCNCRSLLFTSSGAVYGRIPYGVFVEESSNIAPDPVQPISAYGEGKRLAELLCSIYASQSGMRTSILRCFAFVGPFMSFQSHFAIGNFIQDVISGGSPIIKGDDRTVRSYMYGADLVRSILRLLAQPKEKVALNTVNVGSDETTTIRGLAESVSTALGSEQAIQFLGKRNEGQAIDWYVPATKKIREQFQIVPRFNLIDSVQKTGDWLKRVQTY